MLGFRKTESSCFQLNQTNGLAKIHQYKIPGLHIDIIIYKGSLHCWQRMNIFQRCKLRSHHHCCKDRIKNSIFKMSQVKIFRSNIHFCIPQVSNSLILAHFQDLRLLQMSPDFPLNKHHKEKRTTTRGSLYVAVPCLTLCGFLQQGLETFFKFCHTCWWLLTYIIYKYSRPIVKASSGFVFYEVKRKKKIHVSS